MGAPGDCVLVSRAPLFTGWPFSVRKSPSFGSPSFQPLLFFGLVLVLDLIKFLPGCVGFYSFKVLIANYSRDSVRSSACPKLGH